MMTLQDVKQAVDRLSPGARRELREYLAQRESTEQPVLELTPEERIRRLDAAVEALREGLTQQELDEMTEAMNTEYIEPIDEDQWKD
ncbi:MAG: hypothetical protein K8S97_04515 [Anaerolineae bacterium]|nr:hypothetical protein [Anaerolineae bacterium]